MKQVGGGEKEQVKEGMGKWRGGEYNSEKDDDKGRGRRQTG
jgi:hypothetical protein